MYHTNHSHWNVAEISMLMVSTYYLQRIDINNNLTINDVKVRWPFLAHSHYLNEHFETLTQVNAIKRIQDYMSNAANLMKYFTSLGSQNKQCLIIEMKMKKASEIMPAAQHIQLVGLMTMIITTLKENVDGIFWKIEVSFAL